MAYGVSQQVHQGIFQGFEDVPVCKHARTGSVNSNFFRFVARQVANHFSVAFEETLAWQHTRLPDILLQLSAQTVYRPVAALLQSAHYDRLPGERAHLLFHR